MRSVDISGLKRLGPGKYGPWRLGDGRLLRTAFRQMPFRTLEQAWQTFDVYQAAHATGLPTPSPLEVVRVGQGYGVVVEYVPGVALITHVMLGSYGVEEAGREVGRLHRRLHGGRMHAGTDIRARFLAKAHAAAELMPADLGSRLVALVADVPESDTFLHGDLHMGNVVVCQGEFALIDMELAGFGDPIFDLGISRSRMFFSAPREAALIGLPKDWIHKNVGRYWDAQLRGYLGDVSAACREEVDLQTRLLSYLELCGSERDAPAMGEETAEIIDSLSALVPLVGSLGLG